LNIAEVSEQLAAPIMIWYSC